MARQSGNGKETIENCYILDASKIFKETSKEGFPGLIPILANHELLFIVCELRSHQDKHFLEIGYKSLSSQSASEYVEFTSTPLHFGGERKWFICPKCQRRRGKLYLPPVCSRFRCRMCHSLTYRSCQESRKWDSFYKMMGRRMGTNIAEVKATLKDL